MIDWNVRIGDILVVLSLAGTCIFYAFRSGRFAESILNMQIEITELKEATKSMLVIITQQAVHTVRLDTQADRLNAIDDKIEKLRMGERLVPGPHHR